MPADKTIDTVLLIITGSLLTMGLLSMFVGWVVNLFRGEITSSDPPSPPDYAPSSLDRRETDARQTPIVLPERKIKAEELLTLYALMRRYHIPREAAAAAFEAVDLPFNNNVWSRAAPDKETQITPIAGRPTAAKFHDDPELEYEPLR